MTYQEQMQLLNRTLYTFCKRHEYTAREAIFTHEKELKYNINFAFRAKYWCYTETETFEKWFKFQQKRYTKCIGRIY